MFKAIYQNIEVSQADEILRGNESNCLRDEPPPAFAVMTRELIEVIPAATAVDETNVGSPTHLMLRSSS